MNARNLLFTFALITAASLQGCAVASMDLDAGTDVVVGQDRSTGVDTPRTDAPRDTSSGGRDVVLSLDSGGGGGTVPLYGRCMAASECRDMGAGCLQAFPGGICSKNCASNSDCGSGRCVALGSSSICLPSCTAGGGECLNVGGACVPLDATNTALACIPSCFATPPTGTPSCNSPLVCDTYSGGCVPTPGTGADNGEMCTTDADCRGGRCITEMNSMGAPSGFLSGYCISFGVAAPIMQGSPVPQSNCPPGSGVVPLGGEGPGDSAPCFKVCNANSDCRAGYQCDHLSTTAGGTFFSNGICLPVDCSVSGMTCPTGTTCATMTTSMGQSYGVCRR